jgi:hypothetical protein
LENIPTCSKFFMLYLKNSTLLAFKSQVCASRYFFYTLIHFLRSFINKKVGAWLTNSNLKLYRMRAIITRGLYTFYPLFEVHLSTVTFGLMYG